MASNDIHDSLNNWRGFIKKNKEIKGNLNEDTKRQISQEELNEEINSFKTFFTSKGLTAGFQFNSPQPFMIYTDGILWSGKINDIIAWKYNGYINQNNRNVTISISESSELELTEDALNILSTLRNYFNIFMENWIVKEFSNNTNNNEPDNAQNTDAVQGKQDIQNQQTDNLK